MTPPDASAPKPSLKTPPKKPVLSKPLVKSDPKKPTEKPGEKPEVKEADQEENSATLKVPASSELASQLESLHERLDRLEKSVEKLRRRTPSVFGRFVADLAKVVLLAALLTIAWQTGWISQFLEWAAGLELARGAGE